ncbi:AzlC family ABC transporter permease [Allohahella sp. A8]|uniref:AzlC family ABC transporter permease n=1 Tax=Allohahella sp. A8 TaxID=3141461 RepID=UPI000C099CDD|nr:branched-chain amino acid ABC transporter permease [Hahellaceae bacterium]
MSELREHIQQGFVLLLPVAVMVLPFGLAFSVAAQQAGLEDLTIVAMSMLVFAGASQFAALELWHSPVPWIPLALVVFAVNARHILMGASLYPALSRQPLRKRLLAMFLITDANWAFAMLQRSPVRQVGIIIGGGLALWIAWQAGTIGGLWIKTSQDTAYSFGLDAVMPLFFLILLFKQWSGRSDLLPWCVAAVVAVSWQYFIGGHWYVLAGALAGGVVALVVPSEQESLEKATAEAPESQADKDAHDPV